MKHSSTGLVKFGSLVLLFLLLFATATAEARADYTVRIMSNAVSVQISGTLLQGVPNPPAINSSEALPFGSLPKFDVHLAGSNSSGLAEVLNAAIKQNTPTASTTGLFLDANSNGTTYSFTLGFLVSGISKARGDTTIIDLSWKSFVLADDVLVGSYSLNAVVPTYLQRTILILSQETSTPANSPGVSHGLKWWWNGQQVDRRYVTALTPNAKMFNFSSLGKPIDQWKTISDFSGATTKYQMTGGFNLTFTDQVTEVTESATLSTNAVYVLKANIEAPWGSTASGDSLIVESASPLSIWLMLTMIIACLGILIGAFVLERRFNGSSVRAKVKRSKR